MQFPPSFLDEIRNRLLASEVVRRKVQLKAHGHEHTGLCPFHKEKTPSFTVSDEKGFYHCFGCGAHGDIIKFVMETENLPFSDAISQLADMAGVAMPKVDKYMAEREEKKKSLHEIMELACEYFRAKLYEHQPALDYIKNRKLDEKAIDKFRIGFAPAESVSLKKHLEGKGVSVADMMAVGLLVKNDNGDIYDKFRGRVMFPIMDAKGRVVAFGGRILGDGKPKYLNSPETVLFKKSEILYNENNARKMAFKTQRLVVTEGYMDVIAMDRAGIGVAVAPLGTAITDGHIRRIWHMVKEPVICLDGDAAGRRAMEKVAHSCLPFLEPGYTLKFTTLIQGMDPDDYINKFGASGIKKALKNAKNLSEVLWECESVKEKVDTPERKAELDKRLVCLADTIKNQSIAKYYKDFFKNKLWDFYRPAAKLKNQQSFVNLTDDIRNPLSLDVRTVAGCETVIVLYILNFPHLLSEGDVHDDFLHIDFLSDKLDKIRQSILEVSDSVEEINKNEVVSYLKKSGFSKEVTDFEGLNDTFMMSWGADSVRLVSGWKYSLSLYNIVKMEEELRSLNIEKSDEIVERLAQIEELKRETKRMEIAFGD